MSQKGELTRDELKEKLAQKRQEVANQAAKMVDERTKNHQDRQDVLEEKKKESKIEASRKHLTSNRNIADLTHYALVYTTDGQIYEESWNDSKPEYHAEEIFSKKSFLQGYNTAQIIKIEFFNNQSELDARVKEEREYRQEKLDAQNKALGKAIADALKSGK